MAQDWQFLQYTEEEVASFIAANPAWRSQMASGTAIATAINLGAVSPTAGVQIAQDTARSGGGIPTGPEFAYRYAREQAARDAPVTSTPGTAQPSSPSAGPTGLQDFLPTLESVVSGAAHGIGSAAPAIGTAARDFIKTPEGKTVALIGAGVALLANAPRLVGGRRR